MRKAEVPLPSAGPPPLGGGGGNASIILQQQSSSSPTTATATTRRIKVLPVESVIQRQRETLPAEPLRIPQPLPGPPHRPEAIAGVRGGNAAQGGAMLPSATAPKTKHACIALCLGKLSWDNEQDMATTNEGGAGGEETLMGGSASGATGTAFAKVYCWLAPRAHAEGYAKAMDRIGEALEAQYESLRKDFGIKQCLNPTTDDLKDSLRHVRRSAIDPKTAQPQRMIFHYIGHGVPRPERTCIYVLNSKLVPVQMPLDEVFQHAGAPSIFVFDCASAGTVLHQMLRNGNGNSAASAHHHHNHPFHHHRRRHHQSRRDVAVMRVDTMAAGRGGGGGGEPNRSASGVVMDEERFFIGSCKEGQTLPSHPLLPNDILTSCLTTPIKMALLWYIVQHRSSCTPGGIDIPLSVIHALPNSDDKKTPMGELKWIFSAITDSIAWSIVSVELFHRVFREDLILMTLFRNYLLAERIITSLGARTVSHPQLPLAAQHPLWRAWDSAVEATIGALVRVLKPQPTRHLHVNVQRFLLDDFVVKQRKVGDRFAPNPFFTDELRSLNAMFDGTALLWSSTHQHHYHAARALPAASAARSGTGESTGGSAGHHYGESSGNNNGEGHIDHLPVVLQALCSANTRLDALVALCRLVDRGTSAIAQCEQLRLYSEVYHRLWSYANPEYKPFMLFIASKTSIADIALMKPAFADVMKYCIGVFKSPVEEGKLGLFGTDLGQRLLALNVLCMIAHENPSILLDYDAVGIMEEASKLLTIIAERVEMGSPADTGENSEDLTPFLRLAVCSLCSLTLFALQSHPSQSAVVAKQTFPELCRLLGSFNPGTRWAAARTLHVMLVSQTLNQRIGSTACNTIAAALVEHHEREASPDVRREILVALMAFCGCSSDALSSVGEQAVRRALTPLHRPHAGSGYQAPPHISRFSPIAAAASASANASLVNDDGPSQLHEPPTPTGVGRGRSGLSASGGGLPPAPLSAIHSALVSPVMKPAQPPGPSKANPSLITEALEDPRRNLPPASASASQPTPLSAKLHQPQPLNPGTDNIPMAAVELLSTQRFDVHPGVRAVAVKIVNQLCETGCLPRLQPNEANHQAGALQGHLAQQQQHNTGDPSGNNKRGFLATLFRGPGPKSGGGGGDAPRDGSNNALTDDCDTADYVEEVRLSVVRFDDVTTIADLVFESCRFLKRRLLTPDAFVNGLQSYRYAVPSADPSNALVATSVRAIRQAGWEQNELLESYLAVAGSTLYASFAQRPDKQSNFSQRIQYDHIECRSAVFHPTEPYVVCGGGSDLITVLSTNPKDPRVLSSFRGSRIAARSLLRNQPSHQAFSNEQLDEGGTAHQSSSHHGRAVLSAPGGNSMILQRGGGGMMTQTSQTALIDSLQITAPNTQHAVLCTVRSDGSVSLYAGFSSSTQATHVASFPTLGAELGMRSHRCVSTLLPATPHLLHVSGLFGGTSSWDLEHQIRVEQRFECLGSNVTALATFATSPFAYLAGHADRGTIVLVDVRKPREHSQHVTDALESTCMSVVSHLTAPQLFTAVGSQGVVMTWDCRSTQSPLEKFYLRDVATSMNEKTTSSKKRGSVATMAATEPAADYGGENLSVAELHPCFVSRPLTVYGAGLRSRIFARQTKLAKLSNSAAVSACAWHPYEASCVVAFGGGRFALYSSSTAEEDHGAIFDM